MIKSRYYFLFALTLFALFTFNYGIGVKSYINGVLDSFRESYLNAIEFILAKKDEHFAQQETIKTLRDEVKKLEMSASLSSAFASKLSSLLDEQNSTFSPKLQLVRADSYVKLSDYNKVFIDYPDLNKSKIYGLLNKGMSAGIVISKDNRAIALLQGDSKCIFSVYIGADKIPGVIFGNKEEMIIRYIPPWMKPKVGDEVFTSGLDNIFFEGIKVGKVKKVIDEESYKSVIVKPLSNIKVPGYFHIITKVK